MYCRASRTGMLSPFSLLGWPMQKALAADGAKLLPSIRHLAQSKITHIRVR
jgi:hypothetical protein